MPRTTMISTTTAGVLAWAVVTALHVFCGPETAEALAFCPRDHQDVMWDTWLYKNPKTGTWLLNYLEHHHGGPWNAVGSALSSDGAHFADAGPGVYMDCSKSNKTDCAVWLGSGSVWKKLPATGDEAEDGEKDEWIMNYSQEYDCNPTDEPDDDAATAGAPRLGNSSSKIRSTLKGGCQSIFFATSKDLVNWSPVAPDADKNGGLVFKYNTSEYARGRWDCIAVLPRPSGGYYGYWTATPLGRDDLCGKGKSCGAGFGQSDDGLHWTTLPTPGPAIGAEVGGLCQLGGKTYMTFDAGHLFEAPAATGPFTAVTKNYNFFTQEGHSAFARLWGSLYTGPAIYAGLIKQVVLGSDGVLRAQWWSNNDVLKAGPLTPNVATAAATKAAQATISKTTTECVGACVSSGMWIEGSIKVGVSPAGIWVELNSTTQNKTANSGYGFGFLIDSSGNFSLGEMDGGATGHMARPLVIDRAMSLASGAEVSFKLLVRNAWSGLGMTEFYVNDVLALPFTLPAALTGSYAPTANDAIVKVAAVHRLSLPEAS